MEYIYISIYISAKVVRQLALMGSQGPDAIQGLFIFICDTELLDQLCSVASMDGRFCAH